MAHMLLGAIALACFVIGMIFARFWIATRDRFFLYFGAGFFVEGIDRLILGLAASSDQSPLVYIPRLISFGLIAYAIIDKNRTVSGK
jgi:hypothetical protein